MAQDAASGCRVFVRELEDGRFSVKYDEEAEITKSSDELLAEVYPPDGAGDIQGIAFELLRQHRKTAHPLTACNELDHR